jgi:hypothetical protein
LGEGALLIYEDHGKEPTHPVSRLVLLLAGIVWRVSPDRGPTRIATVGQLAGMKQDARMGYNFFRAQAWVPMVVDLCEPNMMWSITVEDQIDLQDLVDSYPGY